MVEIPTPQALETAEVPGIVEDYRQGALNAKQAGFDGVELHAANGYLIDQFLRDRTNRRVDQYGGSLENRLRFPLEVVRAIVDVWGPGRVAVRVSPTGAFNDMSDSDPVGTFGAFAERLSPLGLAFVEVVELSAGDETSPLQEKVAARHGTDRRAATRVLAAEKLTGISEILGHSAGCLIKCALGVQRHRIEEGSEKCLGLGVPRR